MTPDAVRHLAHALERHRRWCRANGFTVPPEVDHVLAHVIACQRSPERDSATRTPDDDLVQLLDYDAVGRVIGKSSRTVSRLVAAGELRTVGRGSGQRVPLTEVEAYIARQLEQESA